MRKKICFVVAVPVTARAFLLNHISALSKEYDVYLLANISSDEEVKGFKLAGWYSVKIERRVSISNDIKALWKIIRYFKKMKFDAIHSVTPKAGFLAGIAGKLVGIKHRTHIFTGQFWASHKGLIHWITKSVDRMIIHIDNHILVDGKSQRAFLVKHGLLKEGQAVVFAEGSISGVNSVRFLPDAEARREIRKQVGIKDNSVCYIFLGRLNRDKGIGELYEAFNRLASEVENVFLLLVGIDEENYLSKVQGYPHIVEGKNFHFYGHTREPEKVLNAGDVYTLPTYREGFGTSVLEAACIGLPSITSNTYGVLDASIEGETGLRCKVGDVYSLYMCMKQFYDNRELIAQMGARSRERALTCFSGELLTQCWVNYYHSILPV